MIDLAGCKILICIGTGGVGKTTIAAATGIVAAKSGKKVLVLTIDPSKRLADTLGIGASTEITEVKLKGEVSGQLFASVISHKKVFDDFVTRAANSAESAQRLLQNALYQQLSTSLSGSQEFTSLEMLLNCSESGQFDLIILDTPPAQHAVDFLHAPQKLAALFSEGIAKWFRAPEKNGGILRSIFQTGTKQVFRILETLTGSQFLHQLSDFFQHIEKWQYRLEERTVNYHRMLVASTTQFCLVTAFDEAKLTEAQQLVKEINLGGYRLTDIIINRAAPEWQVDLEQQQMKNPELSRLYAELSAYYRQRSQALQNFVAKAASSVSLTKIPEYSGEVSRIDDLEKIERCLRE